jgi:hypothetical protein
LWSQVLNGGSVSNFQVVGNDVVMIWNHDASGTIGSSTDKIPAGYTTLKLKATDGTVAWQNTFSTTSSAALKLSGDQQYLYQLVQVGTSDLKISDAITIPQATNEDTALIKMSTSNGDVQWYKEIRGSLNTTTASTINVQNDNVYISGVTSASIVEFGGARKSVTTSAALFLAVVSNITDMCKDGTEQCDICQDEATCHSCVSGYLISNATNELKCVSIADSCKTTITVCDTCSSETKCIKCSTGYAVKNSNCEAFKCDGLAFNDPNVCSGLGHCIAANRCCCPKNYAGYICHREKQDDPYYYQSCWK